MPSNLIEPPVFTQSVIQSFFIEALGGSRQPISYLDRFPDSVYTKARDSILLKFLYILLGPAGAGRLRQEYLEARLQLEEAGVSTVDLDSVYTNPFTFARLAEETYNLDASAALLPSSERATILSNDSAFRNRCISFFRGVRAGGTPLGIELVAASGLNHSVDVVENYKALYDQYCDMPLNLHLYGTTTSTNEIVILPRQEIPRNSKQSITIGSIGFAPASGLFTLTYPSGPNYNITAITSISGSNIITMPTTSICVPGGYLSITAVPTSAPLNSTLPTKFAQIKEVISPTSVSLIYPPGTTQAGQNYNMTSTGSFWAYCGYAQTTYIPYNGGAGDVQAALSGLPALQNNIIVTGGPLPVLPIYVSFTNNLADTEVSTLQINIDQDYITGVGITGGIGQLRTIVGDYLTDADGSVVADIVGASADGQNQPIAPGDAHAMELAVDHVRPATSFVTTQLSQATTRRQPLNKVFAGSSYTEVLRFETGRSVVPWQTPDDTHWIEPAVEVEAPRPVNRRQSTYAGFHGIGNIIAYTEKALDADDYTDPDESLAPLDVRFWNTMIGNFNPNQIALYPFLADYADRNFQFSPSFGVAEQPEPLILTTTINNLGIINGEYPTDYLGLPNVPPLHSSQLFWASSERISGTDYLEIDLGEPQAVNHIYFEATNKPYLISASYDTLDQAPKRRFIPVNVMRDILVPSTTGLTYSTSPTNSWEACEINFTNVLGQMIYTRFIRLEFTRQPGNTPLQPSPTQAVPYSLEVRNIRVGRRQNPNGNIPSNTQRITSQQVGTSLPTLVLAPGLMLSTPVILGGHSLIITGLTSPPFHLRLTPSTFLEPITLLE